MQQPNEEKQEQGRLSASRLRKHDRRKSSKLFGRQAEFDVS